MIRMSPEDQETINVQASALLTEFHESSELFVGRNFRTLKRRNEKFRFWQKEQEQEQEQEQE